MRSDGMSFPLLTVLFVLCLVIIDLILQHVMKKQAMFLRILLLTAGLFTINYYLYRPAEPAATQPAIAQVEPPRSSDYLAAYLDESCKDGVRGVQTEVATAWGTLKFASKDATLSSLKFSRIGARQLENPLEVLAPASRSSMPPCFLVALADQVVSGYQLISQEESDNHIVLVYQAPLANGLIYKKFTISKVVHRIDLSLKISYENMPECGVAMTIFYPAPLIITPETDVSDGPVASSEQLSAMIMPAGSNNAEKIARDSVDTAKGWSKPALFAIENRYAVHALIKDKNQFVQDASYLLFDTHQMAARLHNVLKDTNSSWELSFYLGPKQAHAMQAVDKRLDESNNSWWPFALLSRLLLNMLNMLYAVVHNYGLAIIIVSFCINVIFLPFKVESAADLKIKDERAKKLAYIRQKYKDDPEALNREQLALWSKYGTGGSKLLIGIIPTFLFMIFNRVLANAVELHGASMLWIKDLTAADPLCILPLIIFIFFIGKTLEQTDRKQVGALIGGITLGLIVSAIMAYVSAGTALYVASNLLFELMLTPFIKIFKSRPVVRTTASD